MKLKMSDDYVATDETLTKSAEIDAQIVFAGYGIEAPEYQWNDYKDADVKGKVLLMLVSEPPSQDEKFFKAKALTYYGRWTYKYEQAARKGAVAVILIHKTDMASYGWDVVRNSWSGEKSYLRTDAPRLHSAGWVQLEVARRTDGKGQVARLPPHPAALAAARSHGKPGPPPAVEQRGRHAPRLRSQASRPGGALHRAL